MFLSLRVILSRVLVLLCVPFLTVVFGSIAWKVRADSVGPVFFHQNRRGKRNRVFRMWKFRTMVPKADELRDTLGVYNEASGFLFKMSQDPRETRIGRRLRVLGLDELPQFLNVLKGEMSLVGPRPLPVSDIHEDQLQHDPVRWALWQKRQSVRPGITGLWQWRAVDRHSFDEMLALDCEYVDRQSLMFDLQIMGGTLAKMLAGAWAVVHAPHLNPRTSSEPVTPHHEKELLS